MFLFSHDQKGRFCPSLEFQYATPIKISFNYFFRKGQNNNDCTSKLIVERVDYAELETIKTHEHPRGVRECLLEATI